MALSGVGTALATSLLAATGSEWTYTRAGITPETINFYKSDLPPQIIDNGSGLITEVILASFRGLYTDLATFGKPARGDRIDDGTDTYEVQPILDKCYYEVGGMVHIHAKRIV